MMILPITLLTVLYFLIPNQLFGSYGADRRLVFVIFMILIASSEWKIDSVRWRTVFITTFLALFITRMSVIAINWHRANVIYKEYINVINFISRGDRMAAAVGILRMPFLGNPPVAHIPNLAVVQRDAFVNSLFAEPGQQVLHILYNTDTQFYKAPSHYYDVDNIRLSGNQLVSPINIYETISLDRFDYLLVINQRFFPYKPPTFLIPVYHANNIDTTLFRIDKHSVRQD